MYLALASASDGPVLELACGTGRICVPLAGAGHDVTGVDRDPYMLGRAHATWSAASAASAPATVGALELVQADITEARLGRRYDLVILAFNSLLLLPGRESRAAVLETIRDHLSADGRAVIDVWLPSREDLELYDGRVMKDWVKLDPQTGERVEKSTSARYDASTNSATVETFYEASHDSEAQLPRHLHRRDEIHFIGTNTMLAELESAGLQPQTQLGDYSMAEFAADSERLILVAAASAKPPRDSRTGRSGRSSLL